MTRKCEICDRLFDPEWSGHRRYCSADCRSVDYFDTDRFEVEYNQRQMEKRKVDYKSDLLFLAITCALIGLFVLASIWGF